MQKPQIIETFDTYGYYLRPKASLYLTTITQGLPLHKAKELIVSIAQNIHQIQNEAGTTFITKDLAKEAYLLVSESKAMQQVPSGAQMDEETQETYHSKSDSVKSTIESHMKRSMVVLSNFGEIPFIKLEGLTKNLILRYPSSSLQLLSKAQLLHGPIEHFHRIEHLLKNSRSYRYDYDKSEAKFENSVKLVEVGSLLGKSGFFSVFGLLYSVHGKYYLQDTLSKIQIVLNKTKSAAGFFHAGHYVIAQGFMKNEKLNVVKLSQPDLEDWGLEGVGNLEIDFLGYRTKFMKELSTFVKVDQPEADQNKKSQEKMIIEENPPFIINNEQDPFKQTEIEDFSSNKKSNEVKMSKRKEKKREEENKRVLKRKLFLQRELGIFPMENSSNKILFISDFSFEEDKNWEKLSRVLLSLELEELQVAVMVIAGPFFPVTQETEPRNMPRLVTRLQIFLRKHQSYLNNKKVCLLPGKSLIYFRYKRPRIEIAA